MLRSRYSEKTTDDRHVVVRAYARRCVERKRAKINLLSNLRVLGSVVLCSHRPILDQTFDLDSDVHNCEGRCAVAAADGLQLAGQSVVVAQIEDAPLDFPAADWKGSREIPGPLFETK